MEQLQSPASPPWHVDASPDVTRTVSLPPSLLRQEIKLHPRARDSDKHPVSATSATFTQLSGWLFVYLCTPLCDKRAKLIWAVFDASLGSLAFYNDTVLLFICCHTTGLSASRMAASEQRSGNHFITQLQSPREYVIYCIS